MVVEEDGKEGEALEIVSGKELVDGLFTSVGRIAEAGSGTTLESGVDDDETEGSVEREVIAVGEDNTWRLGEGRNSVEVEEVRDGDADLE